MDALKILADEQKIYSADLNVQPFINSGTRKFVVLDNFGNGISQ